MASAYSPPVQALIDELGRLPGIGPKSAQRIAFHLLKIPADDVARLAGAISEAKAKVRFCARCFNVTDAEQCSFCTDDRGPTPDEADIDLSDLTDVPPESVVGPVDRILQAFPGSQELDER